MNALADLPTIDADALQTGVILPDTMIPQHKAGAIVTFEQFAVAPLEAIRADLVALANKYDRVAFDLKSPKGLEEAKAARHDLRENGRYAVQRAGKKFKDDANAAKKKADALVLELAAIVEPVEDKLHAAITAREAEIEAEREAKRQAEAARVQKHRDAIATIRAYLTHAQQPGMTSERIARGIAALQQMPKIGAETFEEFADEAAGAYAETVNALHELHQRVLGAELEAQRIEAQRIENERRKRELDEQEAALQRQKDELAAAQAAAAAPAAPAATEGTGDTPAAGSGEAPPNAQASEAEGLVPGTPGLCASSEAESATASPSGDEEPAAHADDSAAGSVVDGGKWREVGPCAFGFGTVIERVESEAAATVDAALDLVEADDDLLRQCLALVDHANKAFLSRFPSHPKPEQAWWAELREMVNTLQPALLLRLAEKRQ